MASPNPGTQGSRPVHGSVGLETPLGVSAMDESNSAVRVNLVAGAGSGGTSAVDDAAFTVGSGSGTPAMGYAGADDVNAGDVGVLRMTVGRALFVNLRDASGTEVSVGGGTQYNEDDAHNSGDKITGAGVVRKDTATALAGSDGDYALMEVDALGRLHSIPGFLVSTANSTTAVLAGGATFTGTGEDVGPYGTICISVVASHGSATDGLSLEGSADNTNWSVTDTYTYVATNMRLYSLGAQARYFRVRYTNGATLQTSFRLQTIYRSATFKGSSHRISDQISGENDGELVKAVLTGFDGSNYQNVRTNSQGRLQVTNDSVVTDDAAFTPASGLVTVIGGMADETGPDSVDEGDAGAIRMTLARGMHANLRTAAGTEITAGNGVAAAALRVSIASDSTGVIAVTDNAGSLTIDNATLAVVGNGAAATALRVSMANDSTGVLASVGAISTSVTPGTAAGNLGKAEDAGHSSGDTGVFMLAVRNDAQTTFAGTDADYSPIAVDPKGNLMVGGNIAHDGADAGNPIKVGYKAIAHGTNPTAVAANDRSDAYCNRAGIPWTIGGHPNAISREFTFAAADGAQTNTALVSVSAGTKIVVTMADVVASAANTVDAAVRVGFGTATLPAAATSGASGIFLSHRKLAPGSGLVKGNGSAAICVGADDEDIRYTGDAPTGGHITITLTYYTIES